MIHFIITIFYVCGLLSYIRKGLGYAIVISTTYPVA